MASPARPAGADVVAPGGSVRAEEIAWSAAVLVSELDTFYPRSLIAFIERDMEYHHAAALRLAEPLGIDSERLVLVNVSRECLGSPLLEEYLVEHRLTPDASVVLVDSGFNGNVVRGVEGLLGDAAHSALILSERPDLPSSYATLAALGISSAMSTLAIKLEVERSVEHLPHRNARAIGYRRAASGIEPVLHRQDESARAAWGQRAVAFRAELDAALDDPGMVQRARDFAEVTRTLSSALDDGWKGLSIGIDVDSFLPNGVGGARVETVLAFRDFLHRAGRCQDLTLVLFGRGRPGHRATEVGRLIAPEDADLLGRACEPAEGEPVSCDVVVSADGPEDHQRQMYQAWVSIENQRPPRALEVGEVTGLLESCLASPEGRGLVRDFVLAAERGEICRGVRRDGLEVLWGRLGSGR